ncbi:VOC family protein [Pseudidiomarina sediminum]|uniref:VOC family protein n=1 Tax=Pseudidiomarina sediminum TaxID=431675 RepID=UPI001C982DBF|nr:VOC family protein [Pseudidiomarina sediminum]MBY6063671.1 VOC family protein [Pseudidiomarina sediminum]
MFIEATSLTIVTPELETAKAFYQEHFAAHPVFDCGWYVVLAFAHSSAAQQLCLMQPQSGMAPYQGGMFLNLQVDHADTIHHKLKQQGVAIALPLEDHAWGDRGFGVLDPAGLMVYCYHPIAANEEFQQYFK